MSKDEAKSNCSMFKYYGIDMRVTSLPGLRTDDEVLLWGDRLLSGEAQPGVWTKILFCLS